MKPDVYSEAYINNNPKSLVLKFILKVGFERPMIFGRRLVSEWFIFGTSLSREEAAEEIG